MTRVQYITREELNTLTGSEYADNAETDMKIYEASELIKQFCFGVQDYDTTTAPDNLKLATAYQVVYMDNTNDNEYAGNSKSVSIGQTSETTGYGGTGSQEWVKISPKSRRYLIDSTDPLMVRML